VKTWQRVTVIIFSCLIFSPVVIISIVSRDQISFLPHIFIKEYWKFLGSLVSVAFGFFLVNILLRQKERSETVGQAKKVISAHISKLKWLCEEIIRLLSFQYSEQQLEDSRKRDEKINRLVKRIGKLATGLENLVLEPRAFEDDTVRGVYFDGIWGELLSLIEKFPEFSNFRVKYDDFVFLITETKRLVEQYLEELG
jgi:hypothetical protein